MKSTTGNNAITTSVENVETKPISAEKFCLDVNGDGKIGVGVDGVILMRYLFEFRGAELMADIPLIEGATRTKWEDVQQYIEDHEAYLDVDKDSTLAALQDGLMIVRHMFHPAFDGEALVRKACVGDCNHQDIRDYIQEMMWCVMPEGGET